MSIRDSPDGGGWASRPVEAMIDRGAFLAGAGFRLTADLCRRVLLGLAAPRHFGESPQSFEQLWLKLLLFQAPAPVSFRFAGNVHAGFAG
jgi:hypothetical protein